MDTFNFDFETDSTLTNDDTNSNQSQLDWTAFQSTNGDDAVAPDHRMITSYDDGMYLEIERFFNGLNQQQEQIQSDIIEPMHVNIQIPDQTNYLETLPSPHRVYVTSTCLPVPCVPQVSSSRSQCYHKLPKHAVKLMQEWYEANIDDPYPRSSDKKRFITEGNITAQQCRSWFANRRQRFKHVKRNQPRTSRSHYSYSTKINPSMEEQEKLPEPCYYCQHQQTTALTTTTTTLNVVINQQTVEQLIQNGLRKLLYPPLM